MQSLSREHYSDLIHILVETKQTSIFGRGRLPLRYVYFVGEKIIKIVFCLLIFFVGNCQVKLSLFCIFQIVEIIAQFLTHSS